MRFREKVVEGNIERTIQRAKTIAPVSPACRSRKQAAALAEQSCKEILDRLREGENGGPIPAAVLLTDFVENTYLPYVQNNWKPSTAHGYRQLWRRYVKPRTEGAWLRDIRTSDVSALLKANAKQFKLAKATLQHLKHFISGIFTYAVEQEHLDRNRRNPAECAILPGFAPEGEATGVYSLADVFTILRFLDDRCATVCAVAAYAGLRRGELEGLTWEAYTPPTADRLGIIEVRLNNWRGFLTKPKTKASAGCVPVMPQLAERLNAWRTLCGDPATGPVFASRTGKPLSLFSLYERTMRPLFKQAGVKWCGFHGFRRGLATNLNALGVDDSVIQRILRHSKVAVTQGCYIKPPDQQTTEAMQLLSTKVDAETAKAKQLSSTNDASCSFSVLFSPENEAKKGVVQSRAVN